MNLQEQASNDSTKPVRILDMQKRALLFSWLTYLVVFLGCRIVTPTVQPVPSSSPTPTSTETATPAPTPTPLDTPTPVPVATLTETVFATVTETLDAFDVRVHPDGGLFVGDLVSFEVIAPPGPMPQEQEIMISIAGGEELARTSFDAFGIADRRQATFRWVWDTSGLEPGNHTIEFALLPTGEAFTRTYTLLPASLMQFPEPDASWAVAESDCCLVYYITGTAADRDLQFLLDTADLEAESTAAQLGGVFEDPITIVFLPRVLGHGGFAGNEIYISYLDRNYAGNNPAQVIHHEMVHILDSRKGGEVRPSIFVEGLAVYLSGGHFKQEPIIPRTSAVLDQGMYIPLAELTNDFYFAQHEISYLQGAALIEYMVRTWGWEAYEAFYRSITPQENGTQIDAIDAALLANFDLTFAELEANFIEFLNEQPVDRSASEDVRLSVYFFDTVRRYQQLLDPSAYFLTAWLLGITEMVETGIVADYVRHPALLGNIALEIMFVTADRALRSGDFVETEALLDSVNLVLDDYERDPAQAFYNDPTATDYLTLVHAAMEAGYDPQQVFPGSDSAVVYGLQGSNELVELRWNKIETGWEYAE